MREFIEGNPRAADLHQSAIDEYIAQESADQRLTAERRAAIQRAATDHGYTTVHKRFLAAKSPDAWEKSIAKQTISRGARVAEWAAEHGRSPQNLTAHEAEEALKRPLRKYPRKPRKPLIRRLPR